MWPLAAARWSGVCAAREKAHARGRAAIRGAGGGGEGGRARVGFCHVLCACVEGFACVVRSFFPSLSLVWCVCVCTSVFVCQDHVFSPACRYTQFARLVNGNTLLHAKRDGSVTIVCVYTVVYGGMTKTIDTATLQYWAFSNYTILDTSSISI